MLSYISLKVYTNFGTLLNDRKRVVAISSRAKEKVSEAAYLAGSKTCDSYSNSFHGSIILIYINIPHSFPYHFDTILFVLFTVFFLMYPFCTQRSLSIIFKTVTSFN